MQHQGTPGKRLPWYLWPLTLPMFVISITVVGIPLGLLALVSIPYFWLFPERHLQVADLQGSASEKARLAR